MLQIESSDPFRIVRFLGLKTSKAKVVADTGDIANQYDDDFEKMYSVKNFLPVDLITKAFGGPLPPKFL